MVNIRKVAEHAGVSTASVSRYLNRKRVRAGTEQRISAAIQELGYSPSRVARGLKLNQTMIVGMVIPDITNPFFPAVVKGVEDTLRAAGFTLMLMNASESEDRERECLGVLQAQRCDGALLIIAPAGPRQMEHRLQLQQLPLPVVYVDRSPDFTADVVAADNEASAREATRHLIRLGHRRIGAVSPLAEVSVHRDRIAGYRRAQREAGFDLSADYEVRAPATIADGKAATCRLLDLPDRPSAVFVTSNRQTIGVMSAIEGRGLRCPEDVSVVGYDSYEWQDVFQPRLTSVAQPAYLMGSRAAEMLIRRIRKGPTNAPERVLLQSTLVVRESCGLYRTDGSRSDHLAIQSRG
jgi:LacI family transcriptional regulator